MTITTKFSIGDSVWVMKNGNPCKITVGMIEVINYPENNFGVFSTSTIVDYYDSLRPYIRFPESACYATKEELLASL